MTFPTLSPQGITFQTMRDLNIPSIAVLAALSSFNRWTLERILNGQRQIDRSEGEALVQLCRELRALQESFRDPYSGELLPFDWRDSILIRGILARRREQTEKNNLRQREEQNAEAKQEIINSL